MKRNNNWWVVWLCCAITLLISYSCIAHAQTQVIQGPQGPRGLTGARGPAGSIAVGATTAGAPGSNPVVTNTGTSSAAVLNFTIPRGSLLLTGTGAPTTIGFNGDWYFRTDTACLYGPKVGGAWPGTCTSLAGPTGPPGIGSDPQCHSDGSGSLSCIAVTAGATVMMADGQMALSFKKFGKCDGLTDDSAAWTSAKAAAKLAKLGVIQFPAGICYSPTGFPFVAGDDGLRANGMGSYGFTGTVRGTVLKCDVGYNCASIVGSGSNVLASNGFSNLTVTHGTTSGTGACFNVDATAGTLNDVSLTNIKAYQCTNAINLAAGQGSGGYLFGINLDVVDASVIGGYGLKITGRTGQGHFRKVYITAPQPVVMDGGTGRETGNLQFDLLTPSNGDSSHFCMDLKDVSQLTFTESHLESCSYGLVALRSVEDAAFRGGYWQQAGSAMGFYLGGGTNAGGNQNIVIDPKGWTNSSSHKLFTSRNASQTSDIQVGWAARHQITPADIEADAVSGNGLPVFIGSGARAFAVPLFWGDSWKFSDATTGANTQGNYYDGIWRDATTNKIHVGSSTAPGTNGVQFDADTRWTAGASITGAGGQFSWTADPSNGRRFRVFNPAGQYGFDWYSDASTGTPLYAQHRICGATDNSKCLFFGFDTGSNYGFAQSYASYHQADRTTFTAPFHWNPYGGGISINKDADPCTGCSADGSGAANFDGGFRVGNAQVVGTDGKLAHGSLPTLVSGDIPANAANTSGTAANLSGTPALPNGTTATTQAAGDNSTKLATTAYADAEVSGKAIMTWSAYAPGNVNANGSWGDITPVKAITVLSINVNLGTAGTCTTGTTFCVTAGADCSTTTAKVLSNNTGHLVVTGLTENFAAGTVAYVRTVSGTCTVNPQNANIAIQYKMQ